MSVDVEQSGSGMEGPFEETMPSVTPVVDRTAAFSAASTSPAIPRKFFHWLLAGIAVLGLGGLAAEHLFSSTGLNPVAHAPSHTATTIAAPTAVSLPAGRSEQLSASLRAFMDLTDLRAAPAPEYTLTDQAGQPYPVTGQSSKAVVLTFFNGSCNDICPVIAAEIRQADNDLGSAARNVDFVTINTDPSALATSGLSGAQAELGALPNWHILTGPLATMNDVWKSYGITISVVPNTGVQAHNEAIYFIDPQGREDYRGTPFANENRTGTYSLSPADLTRWGSGIATFARQVATR
jgi:protein SCO1/2